MLSLIIGGSASGKSAYAEALVSRLDGKPIYLATMEPYGEEAQTRIERHRAQRRDRGFETLECPADLASLTLPPQANVLLEDLGNLLANEMFSPTGGGAERAMQGLEALRRSCAHLTIVSNEVFSGGDRYEGETLRYLWELARLNRQLAAEADLVVELVCGLPNLLKGELPT